MLGLLQVRKSNAQLQNGSCEIIILKNNDKKLNDISGSDVARLGTAFSRLREEGPAAIHENHAMWASGRNRGRFP